MDADGEVGERSGELTRAIAGLESFAPTPERGRPEEVFQLVIAQAKCLPILVTT